MSDLIDEPVDVVVHKQTFHGIKRDNNHLIPCGELIKRFKLLELYDNSTLSRRRMKMGIVTFLALPTEISILRKENIISSSTNRCVLMDKNSAEKYVEAILKTRGVSVDSLQQNVTEEPLHTAPRHTTGNMDTTGTDIEQADILSEGNSLQEDQSLAVEMNSDSETVTHSSTIQKHPPTPHIVIREDEGSHTAFNDEVVPGFSDEESPITQASSKGSTKGRKRTPPMPEELMKEIEGLEIFYAAPFNHERKGKALSSITLNKTKEQLLTFFQYCRRMGKTLQPGLVLDKALLDKFLLFLREEKNSTAGTMCCYSQSLVRAVKYFDKEEKTTQLQILHNYIAAFQKEAEVNRDKSWEELKAKGRWLSWKEVLDVLAQLNDDYNSSTDWERIKLCRALLLLLLYTAIPPGRGREYRELHFKIHEGEISGPYESRSSKNIMHFSSYEGKAIMYITDHKTGHSTGPQMISCPDDSYFMNVLSDYLLRYRNKIPNSSKSTILFLDDDGGCYNSKNWTKYIQSIFFKYTGVGGVSIHALRSSFVTFAGNESTEAVMESIAVAMRHSRRYQQDIYDKRTINEKVKRGVHFASKQVQQALRRPPPAIDVTSPKKYFKSSVDDSDEDSDESTSSNVVVPGESVAMLASDSTESRPKLLFAKVIEMNATAKMALLNELVETFPGYYRLKIGSNRWEEKLSCLITGIDMVYSREHRAYELRTPLDDITQLQILQ